jgi:hypothetical protein
MDAVFSVVELSGLVSGVLAIVLGLLACVMVLVAYRFVKRSLFDNDGSGDVHFNDSHQSFYYADGAHAEYLSPEDRNPAATIDRGFSYDLRDKDGYSYGMAASLKRKDWE